MALWDSFYEKIERSHGNSVCGYAASEKRYLKRHIEEVHEKVRNNVYTLWIWVLQKE